MAQSAYALFFMTMTLSFELFFFVCLGGEIRQKTMEKIWKNDTQSVRMV
jgi:hypothetical protein